LRTYSIKRLTPKEHWNAALFPEKENTKLPIEATKEKDDLKRIEYSKNLKTALKTSGWQLIRNIFGLAADTMDAEIENETIKGRLQVETGPLESISKDQFQKNMFDGNFKTFKPGPTNGRILFTTRNPIDRITHAAKNKGLHSFTELAPGNRFFITLRFLNPIPEDLGMVALWEQGMHQGLLRIGGLQSAGRGRLDVKSTSINLFLKQIDGFSGLKPVISKAFANDIVSGLYSGFEIPDWKTVTKLYLNLLQQSFNRFQGGKTHE
jgi:CRISPR/Cas system CSM-associated protein Csm3 (group 7 of RAMP superfamily)